MKIRPLIKYIGNKYRSAPAIVATFPASYKTYFEPFAGSLAVLGHLVPTRAVVSDVQKPLIDLWKLVKSCPESLIESYSANWHTYQKDSAGAYEGAKARYNAAPNPHDFLFVSRTCYGGVMRFRRDGYLSTPIGIHSPISPDSFAARIAQWHRLVQNTEFVHGDFSTLVSRAGAGDVIYCDPPYLDSQKILYGAQDFTLARLFQELLEAKRRGAFIALSIDGSKKSGMRKISIDPPTGLFEGEKYLSLGGSMLKRFSREGRNVEDERVKDRLLLSSTEADSEADLFTRRKIAG